jgi:uncharacterized protein YkwD
VAVMLLPIAVAFHPCAALALDLGRAAEAIVVETNRFRLEERVAEVLPQKALAAAAREYAQFLAATDGFGHTADGSQPTERVRRQGYDYCMTAENIAYQFRSQGFKSPEELAQRFVEGWKGSPGHRANLGDREATEIGVAVAQSQRTKRYYAVQVFARPHRGRGAPC